MGPDHADESLVAAMGSVAAAMAGDKLDVEQTLQRITAAARANLPGVDVVSITVRHEDGHLETLAPTEHVAVQVDQLQYELREGACYEAAIEDRRVVSTDLRHDSRWPRLGAAAADLGLRAQAAYVLESNGKRLVLNCYSRQPNEFQDHDGLAELFVGHTAMLLGHARTVEHLGVAIGTRTVIGQATGILMVRYTLGPARAFEFLARLSQNANRKLRDIAIEIVEDAAKAAETA